MITLVDALKATRRGVYKYQGHWRALLLVRKECQIHVLWDEVKAIMDASSIGLESARYVTRIMQLERGGTIRFAAVEDLTDAFLLSGRTYTHIIWLYEPDEKVATYVSGMLRSDKVPSGSLRIDRADW